MEFLRKSIHLIRDTNKQLFIIATCILLSSRHNVVFDENPFSVSNLDKWISLLPDADHADEFLIDACLYICLNDNFDEIYFKYHASKNISSDDTQKTILYKLSKEEIYVLTTVVNVLNAFIMDFIKGYI